MSSFHSLQLIPPLMKAITRLGYERPTPIQAQAIPPLLEGRDVLGCAQTGTGKTAAFSLPILQHLSKLGDAPGRRPIRALVLSPTRELAAQIEESFSEYGTYLPALKHIVIFGGVNATPQITKLRRGVDILVATPGRLLDLQSQGEIDLSHIEFFVLDEADRMLDMGFIHDIRKVLKLLPQKRQNLLFSATMPPNIVELAGGFLNSPIHVEVVPESTTAERIDQQVMFVEKSDKRRLLAHLLDQGEVEQCIVFTRTKHGANRLVQQLERAGHAAAAIHGNKSQNARERALNAFREGTLPTLVATDIAARGIDVPGVSHVFNFDLPNEPESYVHRIGRTGRAGESGLAIAFCDESEGGYLRDIERLIGQEIEVVEDHEWHNPAAIPPKPTRRETRRGAPPQTSAERRDGKAGRDHQRGGKQGRTSRSRAQNEQDTQRTQPSSGSERQRPARATAQDQQRSDQQRSDQQRAPTHRRRRRRRPSQGRSDTPQGS